MGSIWFPQPEALLYSEGFAIDARPNHSRFNSRCVCFHLSRSLDSSQNLPGYLVNAVLCLELDLCLRFALSGQPVGNYMVARYRRTVLPVMAIHLESRFTE